MAPSALGTQLSLLDRLTAPRPEPLRPATAVTSESAPVLAAAPSNTPEREPSTVWPVPEPVRIDLEQRIGVAIGGAVSLTLTNNRRTMLSFRIEGGVRHIRLHHMFLKSESGLIAALARYVNHGDRFASKLIDQFIARNHAAIEPMPRPPNLKLEPRGAVYDLGEIQRQLSERYFAGAVNVDITWGRHPVDKARRRARRTIRMGTYFIDEKLIRIHPALDQTFVPRYFVEWVVFHEMLHHVVPMPMVNGRRVYHSAEFREREKRFEHYEIAREWERRHVRRLIARRRVVATN